jgi:hypothetical protein
MANSDGGIIIYGLAEYQDKAREHKPEKIDPIDRTQFSKEWLEHVINNIRPKIDSLIIHPVTINNANDQVVYVVEIPQSWTAHQAMDKKYYKRFNFESVPMDDYEIRDVMGRNQHPRIDLEFRIIVTTVTDRSYLDLMGHSPHRHSGKQREPEKRSAFELEVWAVNNGQVYTQYLNAVLEMPCIFTHGLTYQSRVGIDPIEINPESYCEHKLDNTTRDYIKGGGMGIPGEFGPSRYIPILPGTSLKIGNLSVARTFPTVDWENKSIRWKVHADNAPPNHEEILIKDIDIEDRRDEE